MDEDDDENASPPEAKTLVQHVLGFLLEWVYLIVTGAAITIATDSVWSLVKPEAAVGALTHIREGFLPWAGATFIGLAIFKVLRRSRNDTFISPPVD